MLIKKINQAIYYYNWSVNFKSKDFPDFLNEPNKLTQSTESYRMAIKNKALNGSFKTRY